MDIETGEHISSRVAQVEGIEHSAQVDVERIITLTCKDTYTIFHVVNTLCGEGFVVRHGAWAHVGGDCKQAFAQYRSVTTLYHCYCVGLAQTQTFRSGAIQ